MNFTHMSSDEKSSDGTIADLLVASSVARGGELVAAPMFSELAPLMGAAADARRRIDARSRSSMSVALSPLAGSDGLVRVLANPMRLNEASLDGVCAGAAHACEEEDKVALLLALSR